MFSILFLLTFGGCMTNKKMLEQAESHLGGTDCLANIERVLKENHCGDIEVYVGKDNIVFRCQKVDRERRNLWDSWWFNKFSVS